MKTIRTFVAVEMPETVREQFRDVEARLKQADAHVKWVEPYNIHITLKFLGDTTENQLEKLYRGVEEGAAGRKAFTMGLAGLGVFPNMKRPRVVWIGVKEGSDPLTDLHGGLEEAIARQGFLRENRTFSSHLTIGRVKSPRGIETLIEAIKATPFRSESFEINEVVVMKSTLTPDGPIYTPLRTIGLEK